MDRTQKKSTTPIPRKPASNSNEEVLPIPPESQDWSLTISLVSYQERSAYSTGAVEYADFISTPVQSCSRRI